MSEPLTREEQIKMMVEAPQRHQEIVDRWMRDPVIKALLRLDVTRKTS